MWGFRSTYKQNTVLNEKSLFSKSRSTAEYLKHSHKSSPSMEADIVPGNGAVSMPTGLSLLLPLFHPLPVLRRLWAGVGQGRTQPLAWEVSPRCPGKLRENDGMRRSLRRSQLFQPKTEGKSVVGMQMQTRRCRTTLVNELGEGGGGRGWGSCTHFQLSDIEQQNMENEKQTSVTGNR